jgi:alpha-1,3-mannosyltransferase
MRILHVTPGFYPSIGGLEKGVEELCINLKKLGYTSDVLTLNRSSYSKEILEKYEEYRGIKVFRIPSLNLKYYYIAPYVLKYVRNYDIINIHGIGFFSDFLSLTKSLHNKPLILFTYGGIFHTKKIYWLKNIYFNYWCRFIFKNIDKTISISKQDTELFSKLTRPVLIPIGIDYEYFSSIKRKPRGKELLCIGRISKNKRIENLIHTVYFLKKKLPDVKLYIIGGDWQGIRKELESMAESMGLEKNVIFKGEVTEEEKINYLSRCHLFVSASQYEGLGLVIIEAMASGIPVVANNIEAFRNFIIDGKNGFLADYSKPKESAERICKIMEMGLKNISKNAKITAREYDWADTIEKIINIYNQLLKK